MMYYISLINKNLISISKLTELNYRFIFRIISIRKYMIMYSPNVKRINIVNSTRNTNIYELWMSKNQIGYHN